ncbi:hypothetical protein [Paracoccus sp. T5]|uniref:hypothetical protein n=1 Tax=Paracoccus sp. T5 TaxID=3402161 RepID=UPI003AF9526F
MDASPLPWPERDILARSPNSALGAPELFDNPEVRSGFADLSRQPLPGPQIADVVRRAARWHIRAALQPRDLRRVMQGARFMLGR